MTFQELNITTPLLNALDDLGFKQPTLIQEKAFNVIASGKDIVGIAQTGTGKTYAYLLPILKALKYSKQDSPRVLIIVPTRELVEQVVEQTKKLTKYTNTRVLGVYGGTNINTQKKAIAEGSDILIATPGRLFDLALSRVLQLKTIKKLVIDEVDIMLDLGFRHQLINIFDLIPKKRQNIMFSATMTEDVNLLIQDYFIAPETVSVAVSGTPLENITQTKYAVPNFYTKLNLLEQLLKDTDTFTKVIVFVAFKKVADTLFTHLSEIFIDQCCVIHSNKTQNYRLRSVEQFKTGKNRILITTDVMARGLDIDNVSHVINFDTPNYPENYMHRIGRTGRATKKGNAFVFYTEKEAESIANIEQLMKMSIPASIMPENVEISKELTSEERPQIKERHNPTKSKDDEFAPGPAFHEKKDKNKKVNLGGSYRREITKKYKKPKTRGDINFNRKKRR